MLLDGLMIFCLGVAGYLGWTKVIVLKGLGSPNPPPPNDILSRGCRLSRVDWGDNPAGLVLPFPPA